MAPVEAPAAPRHPPGDTTSTAPSERSVWSPYSSLSSSATPPPSRAQQHSLGSAFRWLGDKSIDTFHAALVAKRAHAHLARVKDWQRRPRPRLGAQERDKVAHILGDALEMARQCYPPRINRLAYALGRELQQWLHSFPNLPQSPETTLLLLQVQVALIPIVLTRIAHADPHAAVLAHDLIAALTRTPFTLFTSPHDPENAAAPIRLLARELASGPCHAQHPWLGVDLLRIVEMVLALRPLTVPEQAAINELALRRQQSDPAARPWEVALFALCASQNPAFKRPVLDPTGLPSLVAALDPMLAPAIPLPDVRWEDVALTLRALAFLSEHDWVAAAVQDTIVRSLLGVFRRSIPERWFCIRFWAMDTLRNILSHRPPLITTLVRENAAVAFASLAPSSPPASPPPSPSTSGKRVMDDYRREASKRAAELTAYIKASSEWKPYPVRFHPVSISGVAF